MAQLVKFDAEEVFKKVGVKLHHDKLCGGPGGGGGGAQRFGLCGGPGGGGGGAQGFGGQQTATVYGKDLTKENPASWTNHGRIAEFLGGNVTNSGSYDVSKLCEAMEYKVYYCVAMIDHQVKSTVKLTLELPDGSKQVSNIDLTVKPSEYRTVYVGKFMNMDSEGNIKFSFTGDNGDTWKGLLIAQVTITRAN